MHGENNDYCHYSGLPSPLAYVEQKQHGFVTTQHKELYFTEKDLDRIIEMAWEDRTPFEAIYFQFKLQEKDVIHFMRKYSKPSSFRMWRKRMQAKTTKHRKKRNTSINRFKCSLQKNISGNKISKR